MSHMDTPAFADYMHRLEAFNAAENAIARGQWPLEVCSTCCGSKETHGEDERGLPMIADCPTCDGRGYVEIER